MCICVYICTCVHNHTCVKPACVCFAHNPKLLKCWQWWLCSRNCIFFISQYSNVDFKHWNTDETQNSVATHPLFFLYFPAHNTSGEYSTSFAQPSHLPSSGKFSKNTTIEKTVKGWSCWSIMLHGCIHQNANETYICIFVHFYAFLWQYNSLPLHP